MHPAVPAGGQGFKLRPHGLGAGEDEAHEGPFRRGPGGLLQGGGGLQEAELVEEAAELQPLQEGPKPLPVGLPPLGEVHLQGEVGAHPGELQGEPEVFQVGLDLLPDVFWLYPVQVLEEVFQASPLLEELEGGLLPDALDPGEVVGGVPHEGAEVHPLLRPEAVLLPKPLRGDEVALGVEDGDAVGDELVEVAVGGEDAHLVPLLFRLLGQGGENVVRLVAGDPRRVNPRRSTSSLMRASCRGKSSGVGALPAL